LSYQKVSTAGNDAFQERGGSVCLDSPRGVVKWIPAVDYAADSNGYDLKYTAFGVSPSSA
jgi:hypothetical protein